MSAKKTILDKGLKPKKSFGQNFMIDQSINVRFAQAAQELGGQKIVEIGAGTGSLTKHLLKVSTVHAIERDRDLVPILHELFKDDIESGTLFIHEADGAKFDLSSLSNEQGKITLVGNLPYHLTSSIIFLTLENLSRISGAVFLVQKEVADRLNADINTKTYGFLTVVLRAFFDVEKVLNVNKNCFWPIPKIDSAIIKLKVKNNFLIEEKFLQDFVIFVRKIFQQRRKKLSTILKKIFCEKDFLQLKIDPNLRPENCDTKSFVKLFLHSQQL